MAGFTAPIFNFHIDHEQHIGHPADDAMSEVFRLGQFMLGRGQFCLLAFHILPAMTGGEFGERSIETMLFCGSWLFSSCFIAGARSIGMHLAVTEPLLWVPTLKSLLSAMIFEERALSSSLAHLPVGRPQRRTPIVTMGVHRSNCFRFAHRIFSIARRPCRRRLTIAMTDGMGDAHQISQSLHIPPEAPSFRVAAPPLVARPAVPSIQLRFDLLILMPALDQ